MNDNVMMFICMHGPKKISDLADIQEMLMYWKTQKKKGRFLNAKFNDLGDSTI